MVEVKGYAPFYTTQRGNMVLDLECDVESYELSPVTYTNTFYKCRACGEEWEPDDSQG